MPPREAIVYFEVLKEIQNKNKYILKILSILSKYEWNTRS